MAYADYEFYRTEFRGGKLSEEEFNAHAERASALLDGYTFGRITDDVFIVSPKLGRKIRLACCALCEDMQFVAEGGGISSESVDGYQVSYATSVSKSRSEMRRYSDTVKVYLASSGLLYRGNG